MIVGKHNKLACWRPVSRSFYKAKRRSHIKRMQNEHLPDFSVFSKILVTCNRPTSRVFWAVDKDGSRIFNLWIIEISHGSGYIVKKTRTKDTFCLREESRVNDHEDNTKAGKSVAMSSICKMITAGAVVDHRTRILPTDWGGVASVRFE